MAIEHTLIQPFTGAKKDDARFLRTLATLEDEPRLVMPGFTIHVSQEVASVPKDSQWSVVSQNMLDELEKMLPTLSVGRSGVKILLPGGPILLTIWKVPVEKGESPTFKTGRIWPGNPGPDLVLAALEAKIPKLTEYADARKVLLLEKDAIAGTIESQFETLPMTPEIQSLLQKIDEVWSVNTVSLETESVIFTNDIWPTLRTKVGSFNVANNEFWRRPD